jgi:hypothetical protein
VRPVGRRAANARSGAGNKNQIGRNEIKAQRNRNQGQRNKTKMQIL